MPALILSGTGYLPTRDAMKVWAKRYAEEGLELRYKQCLDHFSPPAQKLPHVQYYARMVCELNNPSTRRQHHRDERGAGRAIRSRTRSSIRLTMPTIIISGTADRNHEAARGAASAHPRLESSRKCRMPGHAVMQEAPWLYDDYCIEFLAKLGLWPGEPPQP